MAPHTVVFRAVAFSAIRDMAYSATAAMINFNFTENELSSTMNIFFQHKTFMRNVKLFQRSFRQLERLVRRQLLKLKINSFALHKLN